MTYKYKPASLLQLKRVLKNEDKWTRRSEITKLELLAVGEACEASILTNSYVLKWEPVTVHGFQHREPHFEFCI